MDICEFLIFKNVTYGVCHFPKHYPNRTVYQTEFNFFPLLGTVISWAQKSPQEEDSCTGKEYMELCYQLLHPKP